MQYWTGVRCLPKGLHSLRATLTTPRGVSDTRAARSGSREGAVAGTRVARRGLPLPEGAPTSPQARLPCGNEYQLHVGHFFFLIEKTFNISHHQGNESQTTVRYHLIPIRMGYYLKDNKTNKQKVLVKMQTGWNSCTLLMGMPQGIAARENRMAIHQKIKDRITL